MYNQQALSQLQNRQQYVCQQVQQSQQTNLSQQNFQQQNQTNEVIVENGIEYDKHGNLLSEEFDLGKDGSFNDFWILIGLFPDELETTWNELAKKSLEKKGFNVVVERRENKFIELLRGDKFDVVWLISCLKKYDLFNDQEFKNAVFNYHKTGKGLFIFGDNDPYYLHANLVLPELVGCSLQGNNPGNKTLSFGSTREIGQFDQLHLIFAGINNLYEGITICYPDQDSKLTTLAVGTNGEPCVLSCEKG